MAVIEATAGAALEQLAAGSVVAETRIEIASRIGGRIAEMQVQEGDDVRRGQLLVRLDAAEVKGGIRQARAGVATAEAAARDAAADLERYQALADRGSASNNELRKMQLRYDAAREALNQARAAFDIAGAQSGQTSLHSPIDGVVVTRSKRTGDLALPGQALLVLESGRDLQFEALVPESQAAALQPGHAVEVFVDGQAQGLRATIGRVLPSSDAVARRRAVKITLPRADGLAAGQFGRVSFAVGEGVAVVVPRTALVERGGLVGVFVVDKSNRARFRWLRTGREWADRVEVGAGLQPRERLLARAEPALREGDLIVATASSAKP